MGAHTDQSQEVTPRLGRYRLVRCISTGGMARVYEARRESLAGVAPKVALKVILPEFAQDATFQQLFVNEARIGSQLQHQNLVQIQDFDREGDCFYLVMEYVDGLTLRRIASICRRNGVQIPLPVIAELGRQICEGLYYAHTARSEDGALLRLVHRDIKPSNLILNPQGVVKVLDFGISQALNVVAERQGGVKGTWGYMAPEQAAAVDVLEGTADQYAVAAVLYELAMLRSLFPEKQPKTLRGLMGQDEGARRAATLSGEHGPLASILVRALQRDPAARYPDCRSMAQALARLLPDPVRAREQLLALETTVRALDETQDGPGARSEPASDPPMSNISSQTIGQDPYQAGLPVGVGSAHRPYQAAEIARPEPPRRARVGTGTLAVAGVAMAVLLFTGIKLVTWKPVEAPVVPPVVEPGVLEQAIGGEAPEPVAVEAPESRLAPLRSDPEARVEPAEPEPVKVVAPVVRTPRPAVDDRNVVPRLGSSSPVVKTTTDPDSVKAGPVEEAPVEEATTATVGKLTLSSLPRAKVIVDGQFVRYTPLYQHSIPAGEHSVTLVTDDGHRKGFMVDVPADDEVRRVWSFQDGEWVEQ